jgi:hypothetical protein
MTNKIRDVNSTEVFGEWLKHEYSSRKDFHDYIDSKFPESYDLITSPDYSDLVSNQKRHQILMVIRGTVINGIPPATAWTLSSMNQQAVQELFLIDSSPWSSITNNTLKALDSARAIDMDIGLRTGINASSVNYILVNCEKLARDQSKIITVGPEGGPIVVIDGVHRAVAMLLFFFVRGVEEYSPREVYLGRSSTRYAKKFK